MRLCISVSVIASERMRVRVRVYEESCRALAVMATAVCRLAQLGSSAMLHMMLIDSFIHSDLHPGAHDMLCDDMVPPRDFPQLFSHHMSYHAPAAQGYTHLFNAQSDIVRTE